ncbi:MAG: DUF4179 domain-containing protein [Oscillospiraceae bacterium]
MRSTDERIAAAKRRTKELKHEQKVRGSRLISVAAVAAAIAIVIGEALAVPEIMTQSVNEGQMGLSEMAFVFSDGNAMGYVTIALLAFILGGCVTALCVHLHRITKENEDRDGKGGLSE